MAKWMLIDGFNLAFRAHFAIPDLTRKDGFPTGALHGWVKSIWRLCDQERPDGTLVFFDLGGAQDRLALLPEYKAQRAETPEALEKQIPVIKQLTRAMGLVGIEQDGIESDDLLAAQAYAFSQEGHEVLIVSSDKDFAQMVTERIQILLPPPSANPKMGWRRLDAAGVSEKFGVPPHRIAEYLALIGDTADNIPGIDGVGPKTAAKWLSEYASLEDLIAKAGDLKPERFRAQVAERANDLRRNLKLTTLNLALPVVKADKTPVDTTTLFQLLETMEMRGALTEARERYTQSELF